VGCAVGGVIVGGALKHLCRSIGCENGYRMERHLMVREKWRGWG